MKTKKVKISGLKPHPKNPNTHPAAQVVELQSSLSQFDQVKNIITWQGYIIAGHGLVAAAQKQGIEYLKTLDVSDWPEEKAIKLMIADNRLAELAIIDDNLLSELLKSIDNPLDIPGIDENFLNIDLNTMLSDNDAEPQIDKAVELNKLWKVKPGDLWQIGDHHLLCGDSTKAEDVARVMGAEKADMVFTDPPYGISVIRNRQIGGGSPVGGKKNYKATIGGNNIVKANQYSPIYGDDKPFDPTFLLDLSDNLIIFGGNYFANKLPDSRGWLVWDKIDGMEGTTKNFSDFEMAWTSFDKPARLFRHRWQGLMKGSERDKKRCHPTQKPAQVCMDILEYYADGLVSILDPFLGSGTTMVACQSLNRECRGIEISPDYCAVVLQRMTDAFPGIEINRIEP